MGDSQFVTFTKAAEQLGISRATLGEIIRRGELEAWRTTLNRKVRLVRADDLRALQDQAVRREQELAVA